MVQLQADVCGHYRFIILQVNIWRYGDFTADNAKEFGYSSFQ